MKEEESWYDRHSFVIFLIVFTGGMLVFSFLLGLLAYPVEKYTTTITDIRSAEYVYANTKYGVVSITNPNCYFVKVGDKIEIAKSIYGNYFFIGCKL